MFQQLKLKEININLQEFVKELLIPDNIESLFWLDHKLITVNWTRQLKIQILELLKSLLWLLTQHPSLVLMRSKRKGPIMDSWIPITKL